MNRKASMILFISGLLCVVHMASPRFLRGQAPPGPMPPAKSVPPSQTLAPPKEQPPKQPREKLTLSGSWKLNRDESDDPRKKMQESRGASGGSSGGGPGGSGRRTGGPFPFPGGGGGGRGPTGGRRGGTEDGQSDDDRQRMQELFNPADSLTLTQKDTEVDLTDDQNRKRVFYTDGRKLQKSKDDKYQELAAHWEGSRLVSEDKASRGGKITRSFELAPDGQQLYETLHSESGRSGSYVVIRYVYDFVSENKQ